MYLDLRWSWQLAGRGASLEIHTDVGMNWNYKDYNLLIILFFILFIIQEWSNFNVLSVFAAFSTNSSALTFYLNSHCVDTKDQLNVFARNFGSQVE